MWDGGLGVVGVAWVYCASSVVISISFGCFGAFDFAVLWTPFMERAGFRVTSVVWEALGSLDVLEGLGFFRVAGG